MGKQRPILRYHGGKWQLAEWILKNLPPHHIYVEPFGGAASVLLRKKRSYSEVYNDMSGELVNLFRVARDRGQELTDKLLNTPFARDEYNLSFDLSEDELEQARRTVIRSFMGFGSNALNRDIHSGFRANSNRRGTTPAHDWAHYPDCLKATIERLRGVVIENREAVEVIVAHDDERCLVYADPPYVASTRTASANHGYDFEMTDEQHGRLADVLHAAKSMVVLSGYPSPLYEELYGGWARIEKSAHADGAKDRMECLWMNPAAEANQTQPTFSYKVLHG